MATFTQEEMEQILKGRLARQAGKVHRLEEELELAKELAAKWERRARWDKAILTEKENTIETLKDALLALGSYEEEDEYDD